MVVIFPIIFIVSFIFSLRAISNGDRQGFLVYVIFGLSIYTTTLSTCFILGLKQLIPFLQYSKEVFVLTLLAVNIYTINVRQRFHLIDYLILSFLGLTFIYAVLPIGEQSLIQRLTGFKSLSFFTLVYFTGRFMDIRKLYVNKYFTYTLILAIAAATIAVLEWLFQTNVQSLTGFADYAYYFYNFEPAGNYGLSWTFESEGGIRRFASFFADPIEHGLATLLVLSLILAQFTKDNNEFKPNRIGKLAISASLCSIILAFSRSPLIGYFIIIYIYSFIFKKKLILRLLNYTVLAGVLYLIYSVTGFSNKTNDLVVVIINTLNFSNPSSLGHLLAWVEGLLAIASHPFGLGLGTSGRVGGTYGDIVGGENQFIIIGVQAGVITLALYITIYIIFIKQALKWKNLLDGKERKICIALLLIKVGLLVPSFTTEVESSVYISYFNWFLSGLFISIITSKLPQKRENQSIYTEQRILI